MKNVDRRGFVSAILPMLAGAVALLSGKEARLSAPSTSAGSRVMRPRRPSSVPERRRWKSTGIAAPGSSRVRIAERASFDARSTWPWSSAVRSSKSPGPTTPSPPTRRATSATDGLASNDVRAIHRDPDGVLGHIGYGRQLRSRAAAAGGNERRRATRSRPRARAPPRHRRA